MTIITRFAPSPTGFLHIGGARTALFNYLFSKHHKGKFLLRVEDTDKKRSTDEAKEAILNGLKWLGLDWDDEVYFQSEHIDRHKQVAQELIDKGEAYYCYMTPEEIQQERDAAQTEGKVWRYDGRWREKSADEKPDGVEPVVRLKAPQDGSTVIQDLVQGKIEVQNSELDDMILLRADGTPTYMLSVVVDDHDMNITHVIRGDDHLTNSFRQKQIYEAMGWDTPEFAHIPLIHGADGAKLSKRHGALSVEAYEEMGYLAEAMNNHLLRLGWSHGNDEIISMQQATDWFSLDNVGKSPSRFDFEKLNSFNQHYIKEASDDMLFETLKPLLNGELSEDQSRRVLRGIDGLKPRANTLVEMAEQSQIYVDELPEVSEKSQKQLSEEGLEVLKTLIPHLENLQDWTKENLENLLKEFCETQDLKFGKVGQPLRAALTGTPNSPGIYDILYALEKEDTLKRIQARF